MEMKVAIWFRFAKRASCATTKVRKMAGTGSSVLGVPAPNTVRPGNRLSLASACRSFAELMTFSKAEMMAVASSPAKMMGGHTLTSLMTLPCVLSVVGATLDASDRMTTR